MPSQLLQFDVCALGRNLHALKSARNSGEFCYVLDKTMMAQQLMLPLTSHAARMKFSYSATIPTDHQTKSDAVVVQVCTDTYSTGALPPSEASPVESAS